MTLAFEAPPPRRLGRERQVEELKANPGQWALVEEHLSGPSAGQLAHYFRTRFGCEAKSRRDRCAGCGWCHKVWARWGEEGA